MFAVYIYGAAQGVRPARYDISLWITYIRCHCLV